MEIKSKYKLFGGYGILLSINWYIATLPWTTFPNAKINPFNTEVWEHGANILMMCIFFGIQSIFLLLLMTQCKSISVSKEGITFTTPLLPFHKKRKWSDYDSFLIVNERSTWAEYESIWLIKDNKLKDRISIFYYSNYQDIKENINGNKYEQVDIGQFRQLLIWFGYDVR